MAMTTLAVLITIISLRPLSTAHARLLLLRDSSTSTAAAATAADGCVGPHLLAATAAALPGVLLLPAAYLAAYYFVALPEAGLGAWYAAAVGVAWWVSGLALLVSAVAPVRSALVAGVFVALMFGAFLNGASPSVADARAAAASGSSGGRALLALLGASYNRWAVEALSLAEFRRWGLERRGAMLGVARALGLCRLDVLLPDDGDDSLSQSEALAAVRLQSDWSPDYCEGARGAALGALAAGGCVMRVAAWGALRVTRRMAYWSQP